MSVGRCIWPPSVRAVRLFGVLFVIAVSRPAFAQLSDSDIAALQQRASVEGWTFRVTANDATRQPSEQLCGFVLPNDWAEHAPMQTVYPRRDLPAAWDWRNSVGDVPVRNQGGCGSCWAFGTMGPLEFNILIKEGFVIDLSEQWLVSCNSDGWSCAGGGWAHNYHQWKGDPCGDAGAVPEGDFPYVGYDAPCNCPYEHTYFIDGWAGIQAPPGGTMTDAIKQAIVDFGPVSVAVYASGAFMGYGGGVFNACESGGTNHAVTLVGWDDSLGSAGAWLLRNSWGPGWGEDGYMWIQYGCNAVGSAACFVNYVGPMTIAFAYPDGRPERVAQGQPTTFRVNVLPDPDPPVPGSGWLHYSINGGDIQIVPMTQLTEHQYLATLPARNCLDQFHWFVSAEQSPGVRRHDPRGAPLSDYLTTVAEGEFYLVDDSFETSQGWAVNAHATGGNWERAAPELSQYWDNGAGHWVITQPAADYSADGTLCYVTGAAASADPWANDVDGGPTELISPTLNLFNRDGTIGFWYWYFGNSVSDRMDVLLSNNGGGSWAYVLSVNTPHEWTYFEFDVGTYKPPTASVLVKFRVFDFAPDSLVEVLVDDFRVRTIGCNASHVLGDVNCDYVVDFEDVGYFVAALSGPSAWSDFYAANHGGLVPPCDYVNGDCNSDGMVDFSDIDGFVALLTR